MPNVFHFQRVIFSNLFKTSSHRSIRRQVVQFVRKFDGAKNRGLLNKFLFGKSLALVGLTLRQAECRAKVSKSLRSEGQRLPAPEVSWKELFRLIRPYLHWLLTAIAVSAAF
uniref:LETM1 domain-containing protein n=1 Tax=Bursaphelenchus xylophilus TaxID=6326 RepID=A0A1I7SBT8_BURXY